jgi:hypothetical protein
MIEFAPAFLPRQRRRHIDHALSKLLRHNCCSICGSPLKHNIPTATGFDANGAVALAGECCAGKLTQIFGLGFYQNAGTGGSSTIVLDDHSTDRSQ